MWRVVLFVAVALYVVYILMALLQAFGLIKFSNRKVTTSRMIIPFYYWLAPMDENKPKQPNKK